MRRFFPYFKYLRRVRAALIAGVLCGILYGAVGGLGMPLMIKYVIPRVLVADPAPTPGMVTASPKAWFDLDGFFDRMFGVNKPPATPSSTATPAPAPPPAPASTPRPQLTTLQIFSIALWLPLIFAIRGVAGYLNTYLIQHAGVRILEDIRLDYFRKLQNLPLAFFHRMSTGELISRGLGDTNQLQTTLTVISNDLIKQPATLVSTLAAVVILAYHEHGLILVMVCLLTVPLAVIPIRYVGKKMVSRAFNLQAQAGTITDRFTENLAAVKEVRAFGLEHYEIDRFAKIGSAIVRAQMKVVKYAQALSPSIEILSAVGISIAFVFAYRYNVHSGSFLGILAALFLSYDPIKRLGGINNELKRGAASLSRLEEILNETVTIADPPNPVPVARLQGDIAFTDVTFAYKEGTPVLSHVSAHIPAGTVCALVGPSGAGKTTFANLVPRFYDVVAGNITIDQIDVRAMRMADLRRNIAIVSQDPVLFNDTIYSNLLIGRADATRDEVLTATRDAFAHDFITHTLPQGYDTIVGERGSMLSGGQKQRIAIARAFLRNAPILILDEATSALDSESEAAIQKALKKLMANKTVLIIAHRFSTIRDASMILVFNQGRIVGQGNHPELYHSSTLYKLLYDGQSTQPSLPVG
ncbi:MAG TPA: ABC transporter ATP-binding protein [Opitutaceae bacterium]|jgi:subfamily B ATP-binding cassette protein MsbA|nr:ABC transporter ATP-binding protein [Opitutaceae bacterium]